MVEFFKEFGTLIIAVYAALLSTIPIIYKRFLLRGILKNYPAGTPEIGFSALGPTITMHGTLHAINKDIFVRKIKLTVKKLKTKEEREFDWLTFNEYQSIPGQPIPSPAIKSLATAFLVSINLPREYYITFRDSQTWNEKIRPTLESCTKEVNKILYQSYAQATSFSEAYEKARKYFEKTDVYAAAWDKLKQCVYWEPGEYQLTVLIEGADLGKSYHQYNFTLNDQDFESLKLNAISILNSFIPGRQEYFAFAYPELTEKK